MNFKTYDQSSYKAKSFTVSESFVKNQQTNTNSSDQEDSTKLSFVSWNIQKGIKTESYQDLINLAEEKDFVLIQEAVLDPKLFESIGDDYYWNFSKGYQLRSKITGVMTASRYKPVSHEEVISWEPWLGTPKATSISKYNIPKLGHDLMVVNIHSINFTFGIKQYLEQINKIHEYLTEHSGPVVLSGDFNTWRKKRSDILNQLATEHDLEPIQFSVDHRKKVFGQKLDHIYVRSLSLESAHAPHTRSSDHSPMTAQFAV